MLQEHQQVISSQATSCLNEIKNAAAEVIQQKPWENNNNVPKEIQDKLNDLHEKHQAEIRRLETEIESQKRASKEAEREERDRKLSLENNNKCQFPFQNIYDFNDKENDSFNSKNQIVLKKHSGFLSPKPPQGKWNSRTLFGRPSPVATVLPQRQTSAVVNPVPPSVSATASRESTNNYQPPASPETSHGRQLRSRSNVASHQQSSTESYEERNTEMFNDVNNNDGSIENTYGTVASSIPSADQGTGKSKRSRKKGRKGRKPKNVKPAVNKNKSCQSKNKNPATNEVTRKSTHAVPRPSQHQSAVTAYDGNPFDFHDETSPLQQRPFMTGTVNTYGRYGITAYLNVHSQSQRYLKIL